MVTARFVVGTNEDDAVLRVNDKIRANIDSIPIGIPPPLIVGRGINDVAIVALTLSPKPEAASRWNDTDLSELAVKLRTELIKVDNVGTSYIVGTDPSRSGSSPTRRSSRCSASPCSSSIGKVRDANRTFVAGAVRDAGGMRTLAAGQTLRGVPDIGLLLLTTRDGRPVYVRDVAQVVIGPSADGGAGVEHDAGGQGRHLARARRRSRWRSPSAPAPTRWWWPPTMLSAVKALEGTADPARHARAGDARLRPDGERQGERAAVPPRPRHRLDRGADRAGDRLAGGGGDAGGDPDHHPADAVCRRADGLHDQPRQPVRADLLHRHPGG